MNEQPTETSDYLLTEAEIAGARKILADELGVKPEQLTPEAALDADLGADSLTKVEIIMALEEQFQITVPDDLAEGVQTVGDVFETLAKVLGREE